MKVQFGPGSSYAAIPAWCRIVILMLVAMCILGHATPASASNILLNGDFETLVTGNTLGTNGGGYICQPGSMACVSNLANWSSTCQGAAGSLSCGTSGTVASILYAGTKAVAFNGNGSATNPGFGLAFPKNATSTFFDSPIDSTGGGGKFLAIDGDPAFNASISQSVSGLSIGSTYILTFYMAAGQQKGLSGTTTEWWDVNFGAQSFRSTVLNNASQGFVPWVKQTMSFTAAANTQTLTFTAGGTPAGGPPVVLLDHVMLLTPEPGTFLMIGVGLCALAFVGKKRV
jgi:PEP-CTERM motif